MSTLPTVAQYMFQHAQNMNRREAGNVSLKAQINRASGAPTQSDYAYNRAMQQAKSEQLGRRMAAQHAAFAQQAIQMQQAKQIRVKTAIARKNAARSLVQGLSNKYSSILNHLKSSLNSIQNLPLNNRSEVQAALNKALIHQANAKAQFFNANNARTQGQYNSAMNAYKESMRQFNLLHAPQANTAYNTKINQATYFGSLDADMGLI